MGLSRSILLWSSKQRWLGEQATRWRFTRKAVQRFMPGEDPGSAIRASEDFRGKRIGTVLTQLGENITRMEEATEVVEHYVSLLDQIAPTGLDTQISIKPTQLGLDLDAEQTYANLARLIEHASQRKNFVWIDMESSPYVDATLELFTRARRTYSNVGVCLQAYLRRTQKDLENLIPLGPAIRVVKGAYNEPSSIAFPKRRDVDEEFFKLTARLLERDTIDAGATVGVATHDPALIQRVLAHAKDTGAPTDAIEVLMLYGIQRDLQVQLASAGYHVRVLVSYGSAWYPWFVRRLAERPANVWFVVKNLF